MKKGISVLSLGIMIIIIIAVGAVAITSAKMPIKGLNQTRFVTEYTMIESLLNTFYIKNGYYPTLNSITLNISLTAYPEQFLNETIVDNSLELQVINTEILGAKNLELGNGSSEKDYYAISNNGILYYVDGVSFDDDVVYYRVTNNLKEIYTKDI